MCRSGIDLGISSIMREHLTTRPTALNASREYLAVLTVTNDVVTTCMNKFNC